jgi:D-alanine-D-alanine ligase
MTISVNVLMGGPSVEHEVSLKSGLEVMRHLDPETYRVQAVVVNQEKCFFSCDFAKNDLTPGDLSNPAASGKFGKPLHPASSGSLWKTCDVAFLALHGTFGEDGVIQGFLDTIGVPYTGSDVCASAIAMEKIASKFLYLNHGLSVPPWSVYGKAFPGVTVDTLAAKHGFPCFVKCPQSGSSRLMGRAGDRSSLMALISEFERHADRLLVESAINGIEFSCGILENEAGAPYALPPIEIRPVHGTYFDYTAKYTTGESEEIVPAPRPKVLLEKIMSIALHAHMILGCRGVSRTDMIYADDRLYVLETNTLPGMTPNSLLPKAFVAAGGTYGGLLDTLIRSALIRKAPAIS